MDSCTADIAGWMERHTRILKSDSFSRVGLLEVGGQGCYLKLYLAKSPLQKLGFRLGYGRGIHSYDAAVQLARDAVPVPEPRACLLVPEGMVLLTQAVPDAADLRALWLAVPAAEDAQLLMRKAGAALAGLHALGYAHGDCKWSNLLWCDPVCYFVDLERVRKLRAPRLPGAPPAARQLRDLARFIIDAEELGARAEQLEVFLASYLAGTPWSREQIVKRLQRVLQPIRERHLRRYRLQPRPLI
jgi:tRNA A-37 threonylcarbamoyl transferase component Bud32